MIGIDVDEEAITSATSWLELTDARCRWFRGDLGDPLPLPDASVTRVACHDVLECLDDPVALLTEAARVMRPGASSVWSHVDYDALVISGADRLLTRRIGNAYGEASYLERGCTDAQMGRRLAAVVDKSPLRRRRVDAAVLIATDLDGAARHRVEDIAATVRRSAARGEVEVALEDVDRWLSSLIEADERNEFFYAQTAFLVTAVRREAAEAAPADR